MRTHPLLHYLLLIGCIQAVLIYLFRPTAAQVLLALAYLVLAHLVADFPLQTNWVYRLKVRSTAGLALHAATHVVFTALIISDPLNDWLMLALIGLVHFTIDRQKLHWRGSALGGFLLDQAIHITSLVLIATIFPVQSTIPVEWLGPALAYATLPALLMALWVSAVDRRPGNRLNWWVRRHLSDVSQIVGLPLAAILLIAR